MKSVKHNLPRLHTSGPMPESMVILYAKYKSQMEDIVGDYEDDIWLKLYDEMREIQNQWELAQLR